MKNYKFKKNQNGIALAIGMILLLIISIIGVTSMKSALLQDKMAGGLKNKELADAAALSLMSAVERWLHNQFENNNGVTLGVESPYVVVPRSTEAKAFRADRNLSGGYDGLPDIEDINLKFGDILAENPKFMIESQKDSVNADGSATNTSTSVSAEFDDHSAGGSMGNEGGGALVLYRIISKATDTTGHIISGFESVISVKEK